MKKHLKQFLILILLVVVLILPYFVFAEETSQTNGLLGNLKEVGSGAFNPDTNEYTAAEIAGSVVNVVLSLMGIIFISLMVYAGYLWMTDRGNDQSVEKAKKIITAAIIGIVLTVSSFGIWLLISSYFFGQGQMNIS